MQLIRRLTVFFGSSVRYKLLLMVLSPLLIVLPILVGLVIYWGNTSYQKLLIFKIDSDLVVAHQYFEQVVKGVGDNVMSLGQSNQLVIAFSRGKDQSLRDFLNSAKRQYQLDFLHILDREGNMLVTGNELTRQASYAVWPAIQKAASGLPATTLDLYSPEQLGDIDERLREQAYTQVLPTENARPSDKLYEARGMVIQAGAPIYDSNGKLRAILHGGRLLNRNLDFVDNINNIVYREGSLPLGSEGTATLFLDDVRIATNVRLFHGGRAIGTRVSRQVNEHVLDRGETWLDRAFVVNDWYVSGYEPIKDSFGKRIGMLYVGYLEAPFKAAKQAALAVIIALFVAISLIVSVMSLRWARSIFKPLERMDETISAVSGGDPNARVGELKSRDEIGRLAVHFDGLLATLQSRNQELKRWADELDLKVAERTMELEQANQSLRDAQKQLVMSEKLAAIGQLTAGVAHEINNPIAVIQGNMDVLKDVLGIAAGPVLHEIRLIDEQVNRIRLIVTNLFQFARPAEFAGYIEQVDVNSTVSDCLVLVRHLLSKGNIEVKHEYRSSQSVGINRNELQQVLINLIVNAVHAMPTGGTLTLKTRDWDNRGVVVSVQDNGQGIRRQDLSRIFDPFYTTKKQQGTGLGLSVSYALVERYGGNITVESTYGQGSEFSVWLLTNPHFMEDGAKEVKLVGASRRT
jgi:two-component system NtrC family sensor kinase